MAFTWCVRRSASRLASLCSTRMVRVRSISAVASRPSLAPTPSPSRPFALYSTAIDRMSSEQSLLRVIDSEINTALQIDDPDLDEETAPGSFPFKIEDNPGHQTVTLTREYKGEHIKVVVSMPSFDSDEKDDEDDEDGHSNGSSIPLVVTVTKKSGLSLEFSCMAFPDEIAIDALSVSNQGSTLEDKLANEGPDFECLDENLKKTFYKYLEIRGVKASTTNFLHQYMMRKVKREYLLWLKNVKKFMEES
ncbi:hypothetical protein HID58_058589 [Brassica napus]|uniref:BnaC04g05630D protein n=3 Tax=Brassica TaxID=3705 RepID=A0A078G4X8_BRANA|nr:uncharacterized protein At2g39795, mitochondrial-like [Brassica napus]KAH0882493.1 hypothetical protein HID58_058589 [Brassica napus]CAF1808402.1 unnamed protein product [Brassica napus]CDY20481.1 BnaC04g05630D [Brassica napus]VDD05198.1 unnamed protein product [Brassica oleracea]